MNSFFKDSSQIIVKQIKELFEIVIDWETANKYSIRDENNNEIGFAAERSLGIFHKIVRNILRSHRSITIDIWDNNKKLIFTGKRPFYFFFSDLNVKGSNGENLGDIKTRFGFLKRKFDLLDQRGHLFARIESFRWRLWTFSIYDSTGRELGVISKKWGGLLKEAFTDTDMFAIDLSKYQWTEEQKSVLLFSCLSIDLDFFEDNSSSAISFID